MPLLSKATRKTQRDAAFRFLGESVTYRRRADTKDRGTGAVTESNTDATIGANTDADPGVLIGPVTESMISKSGGAILPDDIAIRIRNDDMPETPPVLTSQIIYSGNTYDIMSFNRSADENVWVLVGRDV